MNTILTRGITISYLVSLGLVAALSVAAFFTLYKTAELQKTGAALTIGSGRGLPQRAVSYSRRPGSLDAAAKRRQKESELKAARLMVMGKGILGATLLALVMKAVFVFMPAVSRIRRNTLASDKLCMVSQATEQSPFTVIITDTKGRIQYVNSRFTQLTGYAPDEVLGKNPRILKSGKTKLEEYQRLWHAIQTGGKWHGEFYNKKKTGEVYLENAHISPIKNREGAITHFFAVKEDITERKETEVRLMHLADRDPLTNLLNRRRFQETTADWLAQARRYGAMGALLFLDLDNFKTVNDSFGHRGGDELLINVANVLQKRLRETDIVARLGGDEFAITLPHVDYDHARTVAAQIIESVRHLTMLPDGKPSGVTVSVGIALFPEHGDSFDILLTCADLAMYQAKYQKGDRVCVYTHGQKTTIASQPFWQKRISDALEHDRFVLHLQPIVDIQKNCIVGYEALLRMLGEDNTLIPPVDFLDAAEHFGFISQIDRWVGRKAIQCLAEIHQRGRDLYIGFNLSGKAFADQALLSLLKQELKAASMNPGNLVFEIPETTITTNIVEAQRFVTALKDMGCRFALDDFGMGFSTLSYLKHLPVDYLKINGGFIRNLHNELIDRHLVRAMAGVANELRKQTIAKFVENGETVQRLRECSVDCVQGYHVGMPGELSDVLRR